MVFSLSFNVLAQTMKSIRRNRKLRRSSGRTGAMPRVLALEERVVPSLLGQQLFPADYPTNTSIANAPVSANSASWISAMAATRSHLIVNWGAYTPGSGGALYSMPFNVVHSKDTVNYTMVKVYIDNYPNESDLTGTDPTENNRPYVLVPMPKANPQNLFIEGDSQNGPDPSRFSGGGSDSHLIVWDADTDTAYEMWETSRPSESSLVPSGYYINAAIPNQWNAANEATWNMAADSFRTLGYTSGDAAGLPILNNIARPDEALPAADGGQSATPAIDHALRFTLPRGLISGQYTYPASHVAAGAGGIPYGARFRLKNDAATNALIAQMGPESQVIAHALQQYGLILADIGSSMFVQGAATSVDTNNNPIIDPTTGKPITWNMNDLTPDAVPGPYTVGLDSIPTTDFEAVNLTPGVTGLSTTSATAGSTITVTGVNFSGAAGHLSVLFVPPGNNPPYTSNGQVTTLKPGVVAASSVTIVDDQHLQVVVPAGSGTVDVQVLSGQLLDDTYNGDAENATAPIFGYGLSAANASDQFTYATANVAPMISTQPSNQTVIAGQTATFTAAASGAPTPTIQWQLSTNSGSTWTNISGATATSYSVANTTTSQSGSEFRAVFTNSAGTATTNAATLTVNPASASTTVTFQQGVSGYTGGQDAGIDTQYAIYNGGNGVQYLNQPNLEIGTDGQGAVFESLLRFSNLGLPSNAIVSAAGLTVTIVDWVGGTSVTGYYVKNAWSTADGTIGWIHRGNGLNWATPGALGQGTDLVAGKSFTMPTTSANGPQQFTINLDPSVVQSWIANPAADQGVLLVTSAARVVNVDTAENSTVSSRPLLKVTYNTGAPSAPNITTQPANQTVNAGQTATFTAAASGSPSPTVQWQLSTNSGSTWSNISGATAASYSITNVTASQSGSEYRAVFTNTAGTATTNAATLTVNVAPSITTQPANQTVNAGQTATFTAAASGSPTPTVQWQLSTNSGSTWSNISGATAASYSITNVAASQSGSEYRAVFTNTAGTATTNAVTLTVNVAPSVTTQPANQTVNAGQTATFTAAASGSPSPTVQWQLSTNSGSTWSNISGATSASYSITNVTAGQSGSKYRAVFTNSLGSATTNSAQLTVNVAPSITTQPANQTVNVGQTATFTAAASGSPTPTVQWQLSTNGGSAWSNISGATAASYSITNVTASQSGSEYRADFTNTAGSATTNAATLTVNVAPSITTQPTNQTVIVGQTATFTAAASGTPTPTVQWQLSTNSGSTWTNISGATATSYSVPNTTTSQSGSEYRAVFTNSAGTATTNAATLTVNPASASTTVTFQQGVSGYTGGQDAGIDTQYAIYNGGNGVQYLNQPNLEIGTDGQGAVFESLLRFSNLGLPSNAVVSNASLTVTIVDWVGATSVTGYYVNNAWNTADGTIGWIHRGNGLNWANPGALGQGTDLVAGKSFTLPATSANGPQQFTINLDSSVVQSWIANPAADQGILLVTNAARMVNVDTAENSTVSSRPLLKVTYSTPSGGPNFRINGHSGKGGGGASRVPAVQGGNTFAFHARSAVLAIQPGDILAAKYSSAQGTGHTMLVKSIQQIGANLTGVFARMTVNEYRVQVIDSTDSPHTGDPDYPDSRGERGQGIGSGYFAV